MSVVITPSRWTRKPLIGTRVNKSHPLAAGLVGLWLFNEGGGAGVYDSLAASPAGVIKGSPAWAQQAFHGTCLNINGVVANGVLTTGSTATDIQTMNFTLESWCYPINSTTYQMLVGREIAPTRQYAMMLPPASQSTVFLSVGNGVISGSFAVSPGWNLNVWNHIVITLNSVAQNIYINGILAGSSAGSSGSIGQSGGLVSFGSDWNAGTPQYAVSGFIGKSSIYSRALAGAEVKQLYREPYCMLRPASSLGQMAMSVAAAAAAKRLALLGVG